MRHYVFATEVDEIFGILTYGETPTVQMRIQLGASNVREACEAINLKCEGEFVPADVDQAAWGRTIFNNRGQALLLMNKE